MENELAEVLKAAGKEMIPLETPDGSRLLVLPEGGRVLGLYAPGDPRNFLWTNPALRDAASARTFYTSGAWQNSGGDRTWLAPEIDFFLPEFPRLDVYHQPRALDPGSFRAEREADAIHLRMDLSLTPLRHGRPVALRLSRSVRAAADPLRHERNRSGWEGVQFAGYSLRTVLEFADPPADVPAIGLWSLLQMPHGGEMLLPTYSRTEPGVCFGEVPPGDLRVEPRGVRYRMRAPGGQKIGLSAVSSPGRIGYHYRTGETSQLVVRNFSVDPSGEYVDVPWTRPDELGCAVQICNVNLPEFGTFSELEYHAPAIGGATGRVRVEDVSRVWAFRGPFEQVSAVAGKLLGFSL